MSTLDKILNRAKRGSVDDDDTNYVTVVDRPPSTYSYQKKTIPSRYTNDFERIYQVVKSSYNCGENTYIYEECEYDNLVQNYVQKGIADVSSMQGYSNVSLQDLPLACNIPSVVYKTCSPPTNMLIEPASEVTVTPEGNTVNLNAGFRLNLEGWYLYPDINNNRLIFKKASDSDFQKYLAVFTVENKSYKQVDTYINENTSYYSKYVKYRDKIMTGDNFQYLKHVSSNKYVNPIFTYKFILVSKIQFYTGDTTTFTLFDEYRDPCYIIQKNRLSDTPNYNILKTINAPSITVNYISDITTGRIFLEINFSNPFKLSNINLNRSLSSLQVRIYNKNEQLITSLANLTYLQNNNPFGYGSDIIQYNQFIDTNGINESDVQLSYNNNWFYNKLVENFNVNAYEPCSLEFIRDEYYNFSIIRDNTSTKFNIFQPRQDALKILYTIENVNDKLQIYPSLNYTYDLSLLGYISYAVTCSENNNIVIVYSYETKFTMFYKFIRNQAYNITTFNLNFNINNFELSKDGSFIGISSANTFTLYSITFSNNQPSITSQNTRNFNDNISSIFISRDANLIFIFLTDNSYWILYNKIFWKYILKIPISDTPISDKNISLSSDGRYILYFSNNFIMDNGKVYKSTTSYKLINYGSELYDNCQLSPIINICTGSPGLPGLPGLNEFIGSTVDTKTLCIGDNVYFYNSSSSIILKEFNLKTKILKNSIKYFPYRNAILSPYIISVSSNCIFFAVNTIFSSSTIFFLYLKNENILFRLFSIQFNVNTSFINISNDDSELLAIYGNNLYSYNSTLLNDKTILLNYGICYPSYSFSTSIISNQGVKNVFNKDNFVLSSDTTIIKKNLNNLWITSSSIIRFDRNGSTTLYELNSGSIRDIACSNNGKVIIAAVYNGKLLVSTNSGSSFIQYQESGKLTGNTSSNSITNINRYWTSVACSLSGKYMSACAYNGNIFISTNSGTLFTSSPSNFAKKWVQIVMSKSSDDKDGIIQLACAEDGLFISYDRGANWSQINNEVIDSALGNNILKWSSVAISDSGQYMLATVYGGYVYASYNYGYDWSIYGVSRKECYEPVVFPSNYNSLEYLGYTINASTTLSGTNIRNAFIDNNDFWSPTSSDSIVEITLPYRFLLTDINIVNLTSVDVKIKVEGYNGFEWTSIGNNLNLYSTVNTNTSYSSFRLTFSFSTSNIQIQRIKLLGKTDFISGGDMSQTGNWKSCAIVSETLHYAASDSDYSSVSKAGLYQSVVSSTFGNVIKIFLSLNATITIYDKQNNIIVPNSSNFTNNVYILQFNSKYDFGRVETNISSNGSVSIENDGIEVFKRNNVSLSRVFFWF